MSCVLPKPYAIKERTKIDLAKVFETFSTSQTIDVKIENVGELRGDIGAIRYVLTPSFNEPGSSPP
jgi:hypothetical protein